MRECTKCKIEKPYSEYYKSSTNKSGWQAWCKKCTISNMAYRYKNNEKVKSKTKEGERNSFNVFQNISLLIKSKYGCQYCNEQCPHVLQFHHINPLNKITEVSVLCFKKNKPKFFEEMNKCIVVCSNCHIKIHYGIIQINPTIIPCNESITDYCTTSGSIWKWKEEFKNPIKEFTYKWDHSDSNRNNTS